MAIDLSALSTATTTANALSNLILVKPNDNTGYRPQDAEGNLLGTELLFHYEGENTASLTSEITDHFVEDNTVINDQIALKPEIITVQGFIGELNNIVPESLKPLRFAAEKLQILSAYTPALSISAQVAYNTAEQLYRTAQTTKAAIDSWRTVNLSGQQVNVIGSNGLRDQRPNQTQTKQQVAFQQFYGYWRTRTLFTIQTPWAIFSNMAIQSLRAIQSEETRMITDFEITFKMMRFAQVVRSNAIYENSQFQGRALNQGATETNLGVQNPVDSIGLSSVLP